MNLKARLLLESNTTGTEKVNLSVEKNLTVVEPLVTQGRTSTDLELLTTDVDTMFYVKSISGPVEVKFDGTAILRLTAGRFAFFPVRSGVIVVLSCSDAVAEYSYWTLE